MMASFSIDPARPDEHDRAQEVLGEGGMWAHDEDGRIVVYPIERDEHGHAWHPDGPPENACFGPIPEAYLGTKPHPDGVHCVLVDENGNERHFAEGDVLPVGRWTPHADYPLPWHLKLTGTPPAPDEEEA